MSHVSKPRGVALSDNGILNDLHLLTGHRHLHYIWHCHGRCVRLHVVSDLQHQTHLPEKTTSVYQVQVGALLR